MARAFKDFVRAEKVKTTAQQFRLVFFYYGGWENPCAEAEGTLPSLIRLQQVDSGRGACLCLVRACGQCTDR